MPGMPYNKAPVTITHKSDSAKARSNLENDSLTPPCKIFDQNSEKSANFFKNQSKIAKLGLLRLFTK